ncbi:hypothetical protein ACP275_08G246900 [Erythranthe tilingii]
METKITILFSIVAFLFIFAIDESKAGPQMCNQFMNCTVTINVCKSNCKQQHRGTGFCATGASTSSTTPPSSLSTQTLDTVQPINLKSTTGGKKKCACRCKYASKTQCPRETVKNPTC